MPPLTADASCESARDIFDANPRLFAVAIVDEEHRPIGVINRFKFLERLASRFGRELILKKPVTHLMEGETLVLDEATPIDEVGNRLLDDQNRYLFDGFIVTREGRYRGLGTGIDLVRALTERRHAELQQMAFHDLLTGLPNRVMFEQQLVAAIADASAASRGLAVIFVDLDRFKDVNDTYGHRFGDLVLCAAGHRLRQAVRRGDIVARLSGDEFAVVLPDIESAEDADGVARVLLQGSAAPLAINERDVIVTCSIGVAMFPEHGDNMEALLRAADAAQYHAKEVRNAWHRYRPEMHEGRPRTPGSSVLRHAVEMRRLDVHYQPIVALATGDVCAVEALVRWTYDGVAVPAGDIVRVAEESGCIGALTEFVMRTGMEQMREWDATTGRSNLQLSINISAIQVNEGGLVSMTDRLLSECQFDPRRLEIELTERAAMRASSATLSTFDELRARGITLTLDDFGTGYSALSRLERLPIDAMKIDKSFLENVAPDKNGIIARAIIAMGHALGLTIVGEGVETPEQLAFLKREGCELAQGYLLGRPGPAAALFSGQETTEVRS